MKSKKVFRADVDWRDSSALAFTVFENDNQTMTMVREALAQGRVRLAYQPVVIAGNTSRNAFHEGLIRILDKSGRPIPAGAFINAVEAHEIGREIDCAALSLGLHTLVQHPDIRLSINMSARSIGYPKWMRILRQNINENPGLCARLILEISETSAMQLPEIVLNFMRNWRQKGVSFAMDDYGSGHLSIPQLKEFEFDILKIDGRFTHGIHKKDKYHMVTAALLAVAKQFGRISVAEAVETKADADWLTALGLDMLQGYAFGAPTVNPDWMAAETQKTA